MAGPRLLPGRRQQGSALLISLILLVVLMLFGVTAIRTGMVNLRIARNVQLTMEAQAAAQQMIDNKISSLSTFTSYTTAGVTSDVDPTGNGSTNYSVVFDTPQCIHIKAAPGYSYSMAAYAPKDTIWRLSASATDASFGSGASARVTTGVKVRLPVSAVCD